MLTTVCEGKAVRCYMRFEVDQLTIEFSLTFGGIVAEKSR